MRRWSGLLRMFAQAIPERIAARRRLPHSPGQSPATLLPFLS